MREMAGRRLDIGGQVVPAEREQRMLAGRRERAAGSVAGLWGETLAILSTHSGPIFTLALFGFAGAAIVGQLVNTVLTFDGYARTGSFFSSFFNHLQIQYVVQAGCGALTLALARGGVTWIALNHGAGRRITLIAACRGALERWPALLLAAALYGVLMLVGIAALTVLLRDLRVDPSNLGRISFDVAGISYAITVRSIGALIPDPGSPFSELLNYARVLMRRSASAYTWLAQYYGGGAVSRGWLVGLVGIVWIVVVDALLRMRFAAIMGAAGGGFLRAMSECVRLGVRRFGPVLAHGWLVRLAIFGVSVLFMIAPLTIAQGALVAWLVRTAGSFWPYPVSQLVFVVGSSLVLMVFVAFATVYDARQYMALRDQSGAGPAGSTSRQTMPTLP
jgi:hypothetical protein